MKSCKVTIYTLLKLRVSLYCCRDCDEPHSVRVMMIGYMHFFFLDHGSFLCLGKVTFVHLGGDLIKPMLHVVL